MGTCVDEIPFISALIVTRNEENYIESALMSLIDQTYSKDKYEIIIIDGMSTDCTKKKIYEIIKMYSTDSFKIKLMDNEKKILSAGWNIGIKSARGDYVIRIDAHAWVPKNFIENNVKTMLKNNAVCVGGKLITKMAGNGDNVVSKVLSSPFGVGNSSFRVSEIAGYADTAVYGLYKKSIFEKVGYFDERYIRNQDIELHNRIRKSGGKFYFEPEIESIYYVRNTVKKMVYQAFGNGKWNMVLLKTKSGALSVRHLIPFAFVIFLLVSTFIGIFWKAMWVIESCIILLHLLLGFIFSLKKTRILKEVIIMPFLFILLHLSYGIGYFSGLTVSF